MSYNPSNPNARRNGLWDIFHLDSPRFSTRILTEDGEIVPADEAGMQNRLRELEISSNNAREYITPKTRAHELKHDSVGMNIDQAMLDSLPNIADIVRNVQTNPDAFPVDVDVQDDEGDFPFDFDTDSDDDSILTNYPASSCYSEAEHMKHVPRDDDDGPPPYATVSTRYALVGDEIIQDDLSPVCQPVATSTPTRALYRPPALREIATPVMTTGVNAEKQEFPPLFDIFAGLDFAVRNQRRTTNVIHSLDEADRIVLARVLAALYPRPRAFAEFGIDTISEVISARPQYMGITYKMCFKNGRTATVRDIDLWRSPNGRVMVKLFWANKKRVVSLADIEKLLKLPQYRAEDGFFLQEMKVLLMKGLVRAPKVGWPVF
ncbi:hypothetical protein AURDEDRAFT_127580 [Auricularia subglabra TFB-10046 SS5]|nr:hypothetical protein AURDEDRAFT_127580 [Auricularia subglabra TFB-10046 SS5]